MTYNTRILNVTKEPTYDDATTQLAVTFEVYEETEAGEVVLVKTAHGFPLNTTADEIKASVAKYAASLESDKMNAEASAEFEQANAVADATIAALTAQQ